MRDGFRQDIAALTRLSASLYIISVIGLSGTFPIVAETRRPSKFWPAIRSGRRQPLNQRPVVPIRWSRG